MTRLRGRAQRGDRVHANAPHGHWQSTTLISSIRLDGTAACMAVDGATDTDVFRAYVSDVLCPSLRAGDIVIMDNLSSHKSEPTIEIIKAAGAKVLFLPAYSPDFNPIEMMWSKIKTFLRAKQARTQEALLEATKEAFTTITRKDATNWFAHCGYSFI